jgi:hypothetical protein
MTNSSNRVKTLQILNWVFLILMIFVNYLAISLPINGKSTKELSDKYSNLFVPAPATFSIWGIIYLLVILFGVAQSKSIFSKTIDDNTATIVDRVGYRFIISCLMNALWIVVWHHEYMLLSVVVMLGLLSSLVALNLSIASIESAFGGYKKFILESAFGVYLGWICVATVANTTAMLVYYKWEGSGISPAIWTSILVLIASGIGSYTLLKLKNFYLGLVVLWALNGIYKVRIADSAPIQIILISLGVGSLIVLIASGLQFQKNLKMID